MSQEISTLLRESRKFSPPSNFQPDRNQLKQIVLAEEDPLKFWETAADRIDWAEKWHTILEWKAPFAKWFIGGKINAAYNCLDRHLPFKKDKLALIWEAEDGTVEEWTYQKLHEEVCRLSNALETELKLKAGDTACIYMPLIPQAVVAMLACARIGVTHSVVFAGFSEQALIDRIQDAECKVVLTADVGSRKGQQIPLSQMVTKAVASCPTIQKQLVFHQKGKKWEGISAQHAPTHTAKFFDAEHPLFFLYTSGTTGKPKGIVHSTGGYLVGVNTTSQWIFDFKEEDRYWCTADIGWITGHSYLVYGPLSNGATCFLYEGALNHPHGGRIWEIIERHRLTILYTAPTAIRSFMRMGDKIPQKYNLNSLRLLGSVGEPINPEAWIWYHEVIGKKRCPIVDTWWQTETGAIMISPLPSVVTTKPGSVTLPFPGIEADIVNEEGKSCGPNEGGLLVIKKPWPSMLRGIHKDSERFEKQYWSKFPGIYFTGDGAHRDEEGYFWIKGRVDDVLNVSGHRLGTMEIESALVSHTSVAEAAVVGKADELKGQAVVAFVTPKEGSDLSALLQFETELKQHVVKEIGALARPDKIYFTRVLPKTRSGKIMRRLLRDVAEGKQGTGDTSTLENANLVELIS